jgi:hypothetical protein
MPVKNLGKDGFIITGKAINAYGILATITGLKFETEHPGMKMTRGPSMLARAKKITGLKTNNREKLTARMREMVEEIMKKDQDNG